MSSRYPPPPSPPTDRPGAAETEYEYQEIFSELEFDMACYPPKEFEGDIDNIDIGNWTWTPQPYTHLPQRQRRTSERSVSMDWDDNMTEYDSESEDGERHVSQR